LNFEESKADATAIQACTEPVTQEHCIVASDLTQSEATLPKIATTCHRPVERENLLSKIATLQRERDDARRKLHEFEEMFACKTLSTKCFISRPELCYTLTGLQLPVFNALFIHMKVFVAKQLAKPALTLDDQLLITIVRLRHNVSFELLMAITGLPKSTVINYFWKWLDLLYAKIKFLVKWPDRDVIQKINPPIFRSKFPRLTCIIDCFEIFVESPQSLLARSKCWSNYKKHCTCKIFIACNTVGSIVFLSPVWGGRASDVHIVRQSGFISPMYHHPGDQILADRGFTLKDDFAVNCSANLIMPAFTKGKRQLSAQEVEDSRRISSVRIHIERVIGLLKNRYTILKGVLPIRTIKRLSDEQAAHSLSSIDKIVNVCAALTNLGEGIVFNE